jgi:hypothetical protein
MDRSLRRIVALCKLSAIALSLAPIFFFIAVREARRAESPILASVQPPARAADGAMANSSSASPGFGGLELVSTLGRAIEASGEELISAISPPLSLLVPSETTLQASVSAVTVEQFKPTTPAGLKSGGSTANAAIPEPADSVTPSAVVAPQGQAVEASPLESASHSAASGTLRSTSTTPIEENTKGDARLGRPPQGARPDDVLPRAADNARRDAPSADLNYAPAWPDRWLGSTRGDTVKDKQGAIEKVGKSKPPAAHFRTAQKKKKNSPPMLINGFSAAEDKQGDPVPMSQPSRDDKSN